MKKKIYKNYTPCEQAPQNGGRGVVELDLSSLSVDLQYAQEVKVRLEKLIRAFHQNALRLHDCVKAAEHYQNAVNSYFNGKDHNLHRPGR